MKYLKTLALLILFLTALSSCTQGFEDFPVDSYSINDANKANDTKSVEPSDSTAGGNITILFDEPEVEEIDYVISIP